jgi:hypothetical protein
MKTSAKHINAYSVTILTGATGYLYPCFSSNHQEALEMVLAHHVESCGLLPSGTSCIIYGECHFTNCDCPGKNLVMEWVGSAEGCTLTRHEHL